MRVPPPVTPMEVVKTRVQTQSQNQARYRPVVSKLCYVFHNGLMTHVCKPNSTNCLSKSAATDAASMRPLRGAMVDYLFIHSFICTAMSVFFNHTRCNVLLLPLFHGSLFQDAFVKIICGNGVFGLWAGLSPTLISALPSTIIYFLTYEYLKHSFSNFYYFWRPRDNNNNIVKTSREASLTIPSVVPMASGICARTVVVTAITPLEMVRIKMQSGYMTYTKLWAVLRTLIKTHGILVLWRGWPPTVMRDAPFSGTYWAAYESIKRACDVTEPTFWFSFMAGAASGGVCLCHHLHLQLINLFFFLVGHVRYNAF